MRKKISKISKKNVWLLFICFLKLRKKTDESCCCHSRSLGVSLCDPFFYLMVGLIIMEAMRVHDSPITTPHDTVLLGSSPRQ